MSSFQGLKNRRIFFPPVLMAGVARRHWRGTSLTMEGGGMEVVVVVGGEVVEEEGDLREVVGDGEEEEEGVGEGPT